MKLRQKLYKLFDVYISEETSNEAVIRDLGRRGKFDIKKAMECIFLIAEEVEKLEPKSK